MTLTQRIQSLLQHLCNGFPEREGCLQIAFLSVITGEPIFLYGRTGSGKNHLIKRLVKAFNNPQVVQINNGQQELPNKLNDLDMIIFQNFNPTNDAIKESVHTVLRDREKSALILSSEMRPENAMGRAEIADEITLTISMPDSLSPEALCSLLVHHGKDSEFSIPEDLTITQEEKKEWNKEIKKVVLSQDTLTVIGKIAEICQQNAIYVPISKWLALTNMARAIAYFNGRSQTTFSDTLFLGGPIWGRSTSNSAITDNFNSIIKSVMFKDLASSVETSYDAEALFRKVKTLMSSSNNLYETKDFNGMQCVCYRVTIAGEATPLYVPLQYVESDEDFNPYNELRQLEKHVRCNYHGTSSCTISIDAAVKGVGLRNNLSRNSNTPGKFESFATLPTYILRENDPEVSKQKRVQLEECRKEAQLQMEQQAKILRSLRDLYQANRAYRNDLFCDTALFDKIQGELREKFDTINAIANKLKDTLGLYNNK